VRGPLGLLVALAGTAVTGFIVMTIAGQSGTIQPWSAELGDDFVFVRALPAVIALGALYGFVGGWLTPAGPPARRADGAVRRFSTTTVVLHTLLAVGFLVALPTGVWQYLGGILDVQGPLPTYLYYRIHYFGAGVVLVSVFAFVTYWWMTGDRSLLFPLRDRARYLRGFAQELPPMLGTRLAQLLRLDLKEPAGSPGAFSFYEKVWSFPTFGFGIGLITITGIVKLLRYAIPIPGPIVWADSTLHVAAMVILIIRIADHLRYTLARWPLVVAIATGWLPNRVGQTRAAPATAGEE
jgi:cytochrome b subunit of formate dehydrogenase